MRDGNVKYYDWTDQKAAVISALTTLNHLLIANSDKLEEMALDEARAVQMDLQDNFAGCSLEYLIDRLHQASIDVQSNKLIK